ncbi:Protein-methionine-sulfoxide reductase catalytic subunit MsrP [Candidatus Entotheonellaceae bacterium PAL068K]
MAIQQLRTPVKPQLIPTNAGYRTFAAPPAALQHDIVPNDLFYVRNHWRQVPQIDVNTYRLVVDGQVDRPLSLTYETLRQMPHKRFQATFECCGNSPVPEYWGKVTRTSSVMEQIKGHGIMGNAEWAGVALVDVLERAGLQASAVEVMFEGADHGPDEVVGDPPEVTYERSLPMAKATHPDTLLVYEMNGETLPAVHGYPLRLLVPGWYGMNDVKWLVGIHVLDHEFKGFYQTERYMTVNGPGVESYYTYHTRMKIKSVITNPVPGEVVPSDAYQLAGAAWSGEDEVIKVDISTDGGDTWSPVDVLRPRVGYSWYRWEHHWHPPGPGRYTLMCRATNDKGETQPMEFPNPWDGRGYANNMVFPCEVEVN